MLNDILKKMGWKNPYGKVIYREIILDITAISFLALVFYGLYTNTI